MVVEVPRPIPGIVHGVGQTDGVVLLLGDFQFKVEVHEGVSVITGGSGAYGETGVIEVNPVSVAINVLVKRSIEAVVSVAESAHVALFATQVVVGRPRGVAKEQGGVRHRVKEVPFNVVVFVHHEFRAFDEPRYRVATVVIGGRHGDFDRTVNGRLRGAENREIGHGVVHHGVAHARCVVVVQRGREGPVALGQVGDLHIVVVGAVVGGPREGALGHVVAAVQRVNRPVHHEGFTADRADGVDGAIEGVADVVGGACVGHHRGIGQITTAPRAVVAASSGTAVPDEEGITVAVEGRPNHRGGVVPREHGHKGVVASVLVSKSRGGDVLRLREHGGGPRHVSCIHRRVGVGVDNGPLDHQRLVVQRTVGIDLAREIVADVVGITLRPGVHRARRAAAVIAATAAHVHHKEAVGVAIEHLPCH